MATVPVPADPGQVPPLSAVPDPAAAQPGPAFQVSHINVTGTSVVSQADLARIVGPHEGKSQTLADLKAVADQITALYRSRGYFLAKAYVPAQPVAEGVARIDVLEGRVGAVKVKGNKYYSSHFIASRFEPLVKGKVVNYESLERAVRLLNENMDIQATVSLQPGSAVGSTDLLVEVKDHRPEHVTASYNNYGNNFVGPNRGGLQYENGNLEGHGDYLSISGLESFPAGGNTPFISGVYIVPLTDNGAKLGFSYSDGLFLPGDTLSDLNITSQAQIGGLTYTNPIDRSIARQTNFSGSFFTKSFNNTILGNQVSHDEIRELQLGYDGSWFHKSGGTTAAFHLTEGLGGFLGGTPNGSTLASRAGAGNSFTKLNIDGVQIIKEGEMHFLALRFSGQFTGNSLLIGEQFSLGGPDSVRGFQQSQILTDSGFSASAEYHISTTKKHTAEVVLFFDTGTGWLQHPLAGELATQSLTGTGLGYRTQLGPDSAFRFDLGFPVSQTSNVNQSNPVPYISVNSRF